MLSRNFCIIIKQQLGSFLLISYVQKASNSLSSRYNQPADINAIDIVNEDKKLYGAFSFSCLMDGSKMHQNLKCLRPSKQPTFIWNQIDILPPHHFFLK